jgi:hypothetical protein
VPVLPVSRLCCLLCLSVAVPLSPCRVLCFVSIPLSAPSAQCAVSRHEPSSSPVCLSSRSSLFLCHCSSLWPHDAVSLSGRTEPSRMQRQRRGGWARHKHSRLSVVALTVLCLYSTVRHFSSFTSSATRRSSCVILVIHQSLRFYFLSDRPQSDNWWRRAGSVLDHSITLSHSRTIPIVRLLSHSSLSQSCPPTLHHTFPE